MYSSINSQSDFLAFLDEYVEVSQLISVLHMARRLKFSVKVERDDMINQLVSCPKVVYSKQNRFPGTIYAVNISRGTAANIYHRILSALDYSDRELDATGEQSSLRYTTINDQKVQFMKAVDHLLSLCYSCISPDAPIMGIHNRLSFERTYKLDWVEVPDMSSVPVPSGTGTSSSFVRVAQSHTIPTPPPSSSNSAKSTSLEPKKS